MTINVNVFIRTFADLTGAKAVANETKNISTEIASVGKITRAVYKTLDKPDIMLNWTKQVQGMGQMFRNVEKQADSAFNITKFSKFKSITDAINNTMMNTNKINLDWSRVSGKVGATFEKLQKQTDAITKKIDDASQSTQRFQMQWLSVMFFGMALQRFFGGLFRNLRNIYDEVTGKQSKLTQSTTRLAAAWSFFQFSVMKALEPLLIPVIEFIIELVDGFNRLPKPIKQVIGLLIILGAVLGIVFLVAGTTKLGLGGIGKVLRDMPGAISGVISSVPGLTAALGITPGMGLAGAAGVVFSALVLVAGVVALLVGVFAGLVTAIDVLDPVFEKFGINTKSIKDILGDVVGTVWKFAQSLVVWIGVGVKNAGILLFGFFGLVLEKAFTFGTILGSIIMLLGQSISTGLEIAFFAGIGIINAFIISAEVAVNAFIGLVNGVIAAYNVAAAYLGFGTLDSVVTVSLESLMVEQDIDAINRSAAKTQKAMEAVGKTVEDFTSADGIVKIFEAIKDVSQEGNKDLDAIWNTTKQISKDAVDSAKDMEDSFDKTLDDSIKTQEALAETKAAQITSVGIEKVEYSPEINIIGPSKDQAEEFKKVSKELFVEFVDEITDEVKARVS